MWGISKVRVNVCFAVQKLEEKIIKMLSFYLLLYSLCDGSFCGYLITLKSNNVEKMFI